MELELDIVDELDGKSKLEMTFAERMQQQGKRNEALGKAKVRELLVIFHVFLRFENIKDLVIFDEFDVLL